MLRLYLHQNSAGRTDTRSQTTQFLSLPLMAGSSQSLLLSLDHPLSLSVLLCVRARVCVSMYSANAHLLDHGLFSPWPGHKISSQMNEDGLTALPNIRQIN